MDSIFQPAFPACPADQSARLVLARHVRLSVPVPGEMNKTSEINKIWRQEGGCVAVRRTGLATFVQVSRLDVAPERAFHTGKLKSGRILRFENIFRFSSFKYGHCVAGREVPAPELEGIFERGGSWMLFVLRPEIWVLRGLGSCGIPESYEFSFVLRSLLWNISVSNFWVIELHGLPGSSVADASLIVLSNANLWIQALE